MIDDPVAVLREALVGECHPATGEVCDDHHACSTCRRYSHPAQSALDTLRARLKEAEQGLSQMEGLREEAKFLHARLKEAEAQLEQAYAQRDENGYLALEAQRQLERQEAALRDTRRLSELQDKLLACYRLGKQPPGRVLDEMRDLRAALSTPPNQEDE